MIKAYDQQQQFIGHYCFIKDISDRREIERLKDEFVSVVSHELRHPNFNCGAPSFGVATNDPTGKESTHAGNCGSTDRLVRLINDILISNASS